MAKRGRGRPPLDIPMGVVDAACQLNATCRQVIEILASQGYSVSPSALVNAIKRLHGLNFEEFRDKKTDLTRLKLVQKAVKLALDGNVTMLIFCLKNMCGWRDRHDISAEIGQKSVQAQVVDMIEQLEKPA